MNQNPVEQTSVAMMNDVSSDDTNDVQRLYQSLTSMNNGELTEKSDEIIEIMDGIQNFLTNYIKIYHDHQQTNTNNAYIKNLLTAKQIKQLSNILQPNESETHQRGTSSVAVRLATNDANDTNTEQIAGDLSQPRKEINPSQPPAQLERTMTLNVSRQQKQFVIYLNEQNDIWHKILPDDKQETADKIVDILLHSKWVLLYISSMFLLAIICRFFIPILQFLPALLTIFFCIVSFFTFNLSMTKRMLKSFLFWFKMYNWFVAIICYISIFNENWIIEGLNWIAGTMIIAGISLHDGWNLDKKLRIIMCFMVVLLAIGIYGFIYFEGNAEYFGGDFVFEDKTVMFLGESVSMKSNCLSAMFNIIIFMGGQLITMIKYKNKASVMSTRPKLIWVENYEALNRKIANNSQFLSVDLHQDT